MYWGSTGTPSRFIQPWVDMFAHVCLFATQKKKVIFTLQIDCCATDKQFICTFWIQFCIFFFFPMDHFVVVSLN